MKTSLLFLALFSVSNLFGQIVFVDYFDAVYSAPIPPPSQYVNHPFDINDDGEMDLDLYFESLGVVSSTSCNDTLLGGVLHRVYFQGISNSFGDNKVHCTDNPNLGYGIDCEGETLDLTDLWYNSAKIHDGGFLTYPVCYSVGYGNHKQGFRILVTNPANNQNAYIYGYIDYTLASSGDVIIHGWYYESQLNQPIIVGQEPSTNLTEITSTKNLVQILDLMGRETTFKPNTLLIYVYDDGSTEKVFKTE